MGSVHATVPEGYITGLSRRRVTRGTDGDVQYTVAHLFKGSHEDPGQPMCAWGYEADGTISIWRGNTGPKGVCTVCLRRADKGLPPAPWPTKHRYKDEHY